MPANAKVGRSKKAGRSALANSKTDVVKVRVTGEVMTVPVSLLATKSSEVVERMGPSTEAIVTSNNKTMGVFMTVEHRNALAETEERLQDALTQLDLLLANRSHRDVEKSAEEVRDRKGMSLRALREQIQAER